MGAVPETAAKAGRDHSWWKLQSSAFFFSFLFSVLLTTVIRPGVKSCDYYISISTAVQWACAGK